MNTAMKEKCRTAISYEVEAMQHSTGVWVAQAKGDGHETEWAFSSTRTTAIASALHALDMRLSGGDVA